MRGQGKTLTLLLGLVLLLILLQQHVVWQRTTRHGTFSPHGMALACQRARTLRSIGKSHTALLLDINRTLGLRSLGLGLILLLLFLRLLVIIFIGFAFLALLRGIVGSPLHRALLGTLLALHCVVAIHLIAQVIIVLAVCDLGAIGRVACFFLLARFLLFSLEAAADMFRGGGFEYRPLAVLANDRFEEVFLARFAGRERGCDFVVQLGERGGGG